MASPASTETIEIRRRGRRRLVGAIAIVVLLVVFVPMLLDSEPHRHANEPPMQIPPKENAPPLPSPSPAPAPLGEGKAAPSPLGEGRGEGKRAPSPLGEGKAAPRLEGFAVQVGAFKDEDTLRQARAKLTAAGVSHYTERIDGGLTRLRAGPFPTREAAEKARAAIQQASLEGQVVALP